MYQVVRIVYMKKGNIIDKLIDDTLARQQAVRESHQLFFSVYFHEYVKYPSAPFHKDFFHITEDTETPLSVVLAFRGCGKSTILSTSYPIWSIIGKQQKKFILLTARTQTQANLALKNVKRELELNGLLAQDLGPFHEETNEWNVNSIVIDDYDARIMAVSVDQSIRGIRHGYSRPDLIICDDLETVESAKTREGREKLERWFTSEISPIGEIGVTKTIVIGNLVHSDCLVMRLKEQIEMDNLDGTYHEYPLLNEKGMCLWPQKYTPDLIKQERAKMLNEEAWCREYLLKIVPGASNIIRPEWIQYYDEIPDDRSTYWLVVGVDLAISEKETADYTAIVPFLLRSKRTRDMYTVDFELYVLPDIIHKRMGFPETKATIASHYQYLDEKHDVNSSILIEDVGYQKSIIQVLQNTDLHVIGVRPEGSKHERLHGISHYIKDGKILFPRKGAEKLIHELVYFGSEKHDDLADSLTMVATETLTHHRGYYRGIIIAD